ncbi:hypothetical protein POM88_018985 [Heracleum sosnowskyi]|uniref:Uncharacterized protein n=1 Tax=Heracleum sosnowskyi TaxID=360622 RepID=A0AAD8IUW6_9APIA|nr:hypothetical protein POM88_018985 [Heracleum sosnowskyi]
MEKLISELEKKIEETEKKLKCAQMQPGNLVDLEECARLEKQLDELLQKQEAYWFIRSRVSEVRDGDRNTKYFHHKSSQRKQRNTIEGLYDENGEWQTKDELVEDIITKYYEQLFTSDSPREESCEEVLRCVDKVISHETNAELPRPFSREEIHITYCSETNASVQSNGT